MQNDKDTNDQLAFNHFVLSAINLHRTNEKTEFKVHLSPEDVKHREAKSKLKNGLVLMEQQEVADLTENALEIMQSSKAIVTYGVKARDLFIKMVETAKGSSDEEGETKKKDWSAILNCTIFIVTKKAFDDIIKRGKSTGPLVKPEWKKDFSKMNAIE